MAVMGTLNSLLQRVQIPTAGTVPSHLSTRGLGFSICLNGAAAQRFISKRDSVSPLLDATTRKPSNLCALKSSVVASRKSPYSKLQSESRNLIWSDAPSSFPTIRCGATPSTTQTRIIPATLATDTEGVTKTASTGARSSAYLFSRDSASSGVTSWLESRVETARRFPRVAKRFGANLHFGDSSHYDCACSREKATTVDGSLGMVPS